MDREKQIEEIYEEIKYGTGSYSDDARSVAEILYDIGYRKQNEVAMEIIGEILLNHTPDIDGFFTMHESELAELKKKYTEQKGEKDEKALEERKEDKGK